MAEDIAPNRLQRAKLAALDLMQQAKSDRLGLVAFAGGAFLQCPMTIDDNAFRQSVESLDVHIIPQGGTALAEAEIEYKDKTSPSIFVRFPLETLPEGMPVFVGGAAAPSYRAALKDVSATLLETISMPSFAGWLVKAMPALVVIEQHDTDWRPFHAQIGKAELYQETVDNTQ